VSHLYQELNVFTEFTPLSITMKSRTSGAASSSIEISLQVHDSKKYNRKSDFVQELSDHTDDSAGGHKHN